MVETSSAPGRKVQCVVVTPEKTVLDAAVDSVVLPMFDGELGVLPGRALLIGRLGPGELRTREGATIHRYYLDGGFAQVRANVVTVLTSRAMPAEKIDTQKATEALRPAAGLSADARAKAEDRARAELRIAHRAHGESTAGH